MSHGFAIPDLPDNAVDDTELRDSQALSVIGRSANSSGDPADIVAANDGEVLRRSGTSVGFGQVATAGIADDAVSDAKIRESAGLSVLGRSANSTGNIADITGATTGHVLQVLSGPVLGFGPSTGGVTGGRYDPWRTPTSGLDASSSDEFIGSINTGIFTWGNQGTATATWELDSLRLHLAASASRDRKCLWYTPPASDWVMTIAISGDAFKNMTTSVVWGLAVLETGSIATPTSLSFALHNRSGASSVEYGFYSATSYTSTYTLISNSTYASPFIIGPITFVQMRYVRSTKVLDAWMSFDGFNFAKMGATSRTLGAHPVNIGIFGDQNTANVASDFRFYFLRTRTDATGTASPYPVGV